MIVLQEQIGGQHFWTDEQGKPFSKPEKPKRKKEGWGDEYKVAHRSSTFQPVFRTPGKSRGKLLKKYPRKNMNNSVVFKRFIYSILAPKLEITCHKGLIFGARQFCARKLPILTMFTKVGLRACRLALPGTACCPFSLPLLSYF